MARRNNDGLGSSTLVEVASRAEWRDWLLRNATTSTGVWSVTTKKAHVGLGDFVSPQDWLRV